MSFLSSDNGSGARLEQLMERVQMNPVLLKSGGQNRNGKHLCSVVVLGKQIVCKTFSDLGKQTTFLRTMVLDSHGALAEATVAEVIVLEGAGSCTDLNFRDRDWE
jgi:adenosylcobyric acid synthase